MNLFKPILRLLSHLRRVKKIHPPKEELDPQRIVNRAIYGTDYDPDEVKLNRLFRRF